MIRSKTLSLYDELPAHAPEHAQHIEHLQKLKRNSHMHHLYDIAQKIAPSSLSVVLQGETGSGKEILARYIHENSDRKHHPFISVNCGALHDSLIESELFGYEKGAFTGAINNKIGLIEAAHEGTLFLDELGEMPLAQQVKLLRVLEQKEVLRIGAVKPKPIDIRVIAATHHHLESLVQAGKFRQDLFFRLNAIVLTIPALKNRPEDITALAYEFAEQASIFNKMKEPVSFSNEALERLHEHTWPGNVRELKNVIERAVFLSDNGCITEKHLMLNVIAFDEKLSEQSFNTHNHNDTTSSLKEEVYLLEKDRIIRALEKHGGNQTRAAKYLGISRGTLCMRMDAYNIVRPRKVVKSNLK